MRKPAIKKTAKTLARVLVLAMTLTHSGCAGSPPAPRDHEGAPETKTGGKTGGPERERSFENNYRAGISFLEEGNLNEARGVLEELGREIPENFEVRNALGILYRRLGQTEKAVSEYRAAFSLLEKTGGEGLNAGWSSHLHNNLGIALREKGDFEAAEKSYHTAIRLDSRFPDPYYNLGVLYDLYLGRPRDALANYKKFLSLSGGNKEVELWVKDLEQKQKGEGEKP